MEATGYFSVTSPENPNWKWKIEFTEKELLVSGTRLGWSLIIMIKKPDNEVKSL